ncbi:MAG: diaminopimelate epimerase [Pseudomonadota bacterium]
MANNLLKFTKMHGLGNDFAVFDAISQKIEFSTQVIQMLADRHFGIGFDQLLTIEPGQAGVSDFHYRIFNADGSESGQCGNGVRCVARFLIEKKLTDKKNLKLSAKAGIMEIEVNDFENIRVNMGLPLLEPHQIPMEMPYRATQYVLSLFETEQKIMAVSMGNPHAVIRVDTIETAPVATLGERIGHHAAFPERTNVEFMQIMSRNKIKLRVYERGAGETLACGTGACAAVVAGIINQWLDNQVDVELPGGTLKIEWQGVGHPVMMTGPAVTVYEGVIR